MRPPAPACAGEPVDDIKSGPRLKAAGLFCCGVPGLPEVIREPAGNTNVQTSIEERASSMNRIAFIISLPTALLLMTSFAAAAEPAPPDKGAASGLRPAAIRNPQSAIHNWAASPATATAPAGPPLRVALVCLDGESWAGDPNAAASAEAFARAMKANAAALPARIGGRDVNYDVLPLGPGKGAWTATRWSCSCRSGR